MPATQAITKKVYVFDSGVPELQALIDAIGPIGPDQRIVILDANSDGVLQLARALAGDSNLDAIHIFSHGAVGSLQLGSTFLNQATLSDYSAALAQIGSALSDSGDLLLYGCNVAQGDAGQAFITQLAVVTGADVAASNDLTGGSSGDLVLEVSSGSIEQGITVAVITAPLQMYSSARDHLNQLIAIDFSNPSADDMSVIVPLQLAKLNSNNLFDGDIGIYEFLMNIEVMAQIVDELFIATNDTNALFNYMKAADYSYYQSMVSQDASLQSSIDSVFRAASPGLLDYLAINFAQTWEGFSGISNALVDALEAGAGGIAAIFNASGATLTNLLPSKFEWLTNGVGGVYVLGAEFFQSMANIYENTNSLIKDFSDLSTKKSLATNVEILSDSVALIVKITDDVLQFKEALKGVGLSESSEGVMTAAKVLSLMINASAWVDEMGDILTAANDNSQLSGLSNKFLKDAVWINALEGFDLAKDLVGVLLPLVKNPEYKAVTAYLTESLVTLSDVVAIGGKTEWKIQIDQFASYKEDLVPIVTSYKSNLSSWIAHADSLSGGIWGTNISSNLPAGPLPLNGVFSDRYDGLLENEPSASGGSLAAGSSYNGTISSTDPGDWFVISLTAGQAYRFIMEGNSLAGMDLFLYSAAGVLQARENGSLSDSNTSIIEGTASETGSYFLVADSNYTGNYTVTYDAVTLPATLTELKDAPASTVTPYSIAAGKSFHGNMNYVDGDYATGKGDWIKVSLIAGNDYRFELTRGTLYNADIKLYDALGNLFANSNDSLGSAGTSPVIQGTAAASGTYYIGVSGGYTGNYTVSYNKNTAPTASNSILTINEDATRLLAVNDFGFTDGDAAHTLQSVIITTLETKGALKLNDVDVTLNQIINAADITAGLLTFTPASNANGSAYASFGFKVSYGAVISTAAYTATINVIAINDAPMGTVTISGFATQGQTLTAANTLADVDGIGTISYQWQADGTVIAGAVASTFVVTEAQVGKIMTVVASYTDGHGTLEAVTGNVGKTADLLTYSWKAHTLLDGVSVSAGTHSGTTDATGTISFTAITDPSLTLTASRAIPTAEAVATASAVNLQDAIAILKMIVGLPVNGANQALSPYQALAADFDGNGTVGLTDAIGVLKHVVGLSAPDPTWHFVNATDAGLATISISPLEPGGPPVITADLGGSSPVQVELVGYLSGDVDGSFA